MVSAGTHFAEKTPGGDPGGIAVGLSTGRVGSLTKGSSLSAKAECRDHEELSPSADSGGSVELTIAASRVDLDHEELMGMGGRVLRLIPL